MRIKYSFSRNGIFLGQQKVKSSNTTIKMMCIYTIIVLFIIGIGVSIGSLSLARDIGKALFIP